MTWCWWRTMKWYERFISLLPAFSFLCVQYSLVIKLVLLKGSLLDFEWDFTFRIECTRVCTCSTVSATTATSPPHPSYSSSTRRMCSLRRSRKLISACASPNMMVRSSLLINYTTYQRKWQAERNKLYLCTVLTRTQYL